MRDGVWFRSGPRGLDEETRCAPGERLRYSRRRTLDNDVLGICVVAFFLGYRGFGGEVGLADSEEVRLEPCGSTAMGAFFLVVSYLDTVYRFYYIIGYALFLLVCSVWGT